MARMSPDERREAIVAATLAVMQRQGIAATTVRDVAAEVGTSSGLIHHYVDSMDELIAEAFARAAGDDLRATVEAVALGRDAIESLICFFDSYARTDRDSGMQLWLDAWSEAPRRPALQRISRQLNVEWQALLAEVIDRGIAEGSMSCADSRAASWRIISLLDGLALQAVAHGDVLSQEQVDAWSRSGAELELQMPKGSLRRHTSTRQS